MPDSYTYIAKPTDATYSYVNFEGKQTYDQADLSYDESSVFYDSVNANAYTMIAKPSGESSASGGAMNGLLMPLTHSTITSKSQWTYIPKPN